MENYEDDITLARFNTGVSAFGPRFQRGLGTFQKIEDYREDASGVIELVVDYGVEDIADFAVSVEQWRGARRLNRIWNR